VSQTGDDATRLRALLDIAKVIGASRTEDLVEALAESARRALDGASLSISRWDRERGVLKTIVNVGMLAPGEVRFPTDETFALASWPEGGGLVQGRMSFLTRLGDGTPEGGHLAQLGKTSGLSAPILVEARVWGEMWVARAEGQPAYTEDDLDFAEAVATQVAAGVVQAEHMARVERLAFTDPLTGLANRRAVDERLDAALERHRSTGSTVTIVLADINRLKQVNDTFGHEAGDRLIVSVAEAVSRASGLAEHSLAARIGGDEFCVVVDAEPLATSVQVAEELCRLVDSQPMSTGISCGVASTEVLAATVDNATRLFRLADAAQYRAKRAASRRPVVAGRSVPDDPGEAPADRRARRGRLSTDVPAALESGLAALDELGPADVRQRVEVVADHLRDLLDAAGWWISHVAAGEDRLVTLGTSVQRLAHSADGRPEDYADVGAVFDLRDYPVTRRAIDEAGSFFVETGMPGNDPAEEATLATAGYLAVLGAGGSDARGGWLVEVYADSISLPMGTFEPVLRSLVAVAVSGAVTETGAARVPPARAPERA